MDCSDYLAAFDRTTRRITTQLDHISVLPWDLQQLIRGYYPRMYSFERIAQIVKAGRESSSDLICEIINSYELMRDYEARSTAGMTSQQRQQWWRKLEDDCDVYNSGIMQMCASIHGVEFAYLVRAPCTCGLPICGSCF